ncbi:MAG TPA: hypothetical protein VFY10_03480 [Dehalococcoidia bacterium]|nr:hypothetical protein [Dehalococcoidia bacterium]
MTSSTPDPEVGTIASYDRGAIAYAAKSRDRSALHHLHIRFSELLFPQARVLDLISHELGASTGGLNFPDSGAWIETFARKP